MRQTIARGLALAGTAALAAGIATAAPAQAASGFDRCPKGYYCGFDGYGGQGAMFTTRSSIAVMGSWNNRVRSWWNRSSSFVCMYTDANYADRESLWVSRSGEEDINSSTFDRTLSSLKFVATERECSGAAYPNWGTSAAPVAAGFGDLDGNHVPDLLARGKDGRLWFLPGNGTGHLIGGGWGAMNLISRHGDLTGDGHEDLVARDTSGRLWLYPGNGKGAFTTRKLITSNFKGATALAVAGDLTGDHRSDLLVRDTAGELLLYPGTGKGGFTSRRVVTTGFNVTRLITPGDLTGDGRNDLLAQNTSGQLRSYAGNGKGAFAKGKLLGSGMKSYDALVAVGDVTGDRRGDLMGVTNDTWGNAADGCCWPGQLRAWAGRGDGTFGGSHVLDGGGWIGLAGAF